MRICLVTREFPPVTSYTGGIGRAFAGLSRAFTADGHAVTVVVPGLDTSTSSSNGAAVVGLGASRSPRPSALANLSSVLSVNRALRRQPDVEVVFAPEWYGDDATFPGMRRSPGCHVTNLTTSLKQTRAITEDARRIGDLRPHRIVQSWLERAQTEAADGIVACSRSILEWTSDLWDVTRKPVTVIPNGIDVRWVRELAANDLPEAFPRGVPTIVFAGRLEARKGVTVLVDSLLAVWRSRPDVRLVLLGRDGSWQGRSMSDRLREIAGEHAGRLVFLGEQPPEKLFPSLAAADVVALPSIWENLSLAGLEALAVGAPIVASRRTGFEDVLRDGENGLLVGPGDAGELASALLRLLSDAELRQRLSTDAHRSAAAFDLRVVARRHVDFFEEAITRASAASASR